MSNWDWLIRFLIKVSFLSVLVLIYAMLTWFYVLGVGTFILED